VVVSLIVVTRVTGRCSLLLMLKVTGTISIHGNLVSSCSKKVRSPAELSNVLSFVVLSRFPEHIR